MFRLKNREEVIVKMYPYAKWFLTGNNFDEEVTTNIWKQSESVKLKFDKNWFFLYEQHAWTWQDTIRSRNVAHLKTDKLFESYEHDPRLYYNYDGYNKEFKEYNEKINYTDFNKFSDSECIYFNNQKFSA